jgi:hypothetical protein
MLYRCRCTESRPRIPEKSVLFCFEMHTHVTLLPAGSQRTGTIFSKQNVFDVARPLEKTVTSFYMYL